MNWDEGLFMLMLSRTCLPRGHLFLRDRLASQSLQLKKAEVSKSPCRQDSHYVQNISGREILTAVCLLCRNFQSEHVTWTTFVAGVVANILSHKQFARLCSRCYPFFPRTYALLPRSPSPNLTGSFQYRACISSAHVIESGMHAAAY